MHRATISLDFLLSSIVLMLVASILMGFALMQVENASAISVKYKAEAIAIAVGSAINHFRAISPQPDDELKIDIQNIGGTATSPIVPTTGGNWPKLSLDLVSCSVHVNETTDILTVNLTYQRIESNMLESVIAQYPLVDMKTGVDALCNQTLVVTGDMEVSA
ncbi:MAG: hypothetical protein J7K68_03195 [Candidatus Diapherotrites archaeon]|nr:hypothetical protein [Candidatus Diapherotrites archaeon]